MSGKAAVDRVLRAGEKAEKFAAASLVGYHECIRTSGEIIGGLEKMIAKTCHLKCALVAMLSLVSQAAQAQSVIVGPGSLPAPLLIGNSHIQVGTEVIASDWVAGSGGSAWGGAAAITNWGTNLFVDGGLFKAGSVTTSSTTQEVTGGPAFAFSNGYNYGTFYGGTFQGGAVLVDAATPSTAKLRGGSAISVGGDDCLFDFKIHGGLYEGGVVRPIDSPATIISRAPAITISANYGGPLELYGGEFVGGIEWRNRQVDLKIHGSDFDLQPAPANGYWTNPASAVVSGKYLDGTAFSHQLFFTGFDRIYAYQSGDYLAVSLGNIPEPTAASIMIVGAVLIAASRGVQRGAKRRLSTRNC